MDTTWILLIANVCISGGYALVKIGSALIAFGKVLKNPENKAKKVKLQKKLAQLNQPVQTVQNTQQQTQ